MKHAKHVSTPSTRAGQARKAREHQARRLAASDLEHVKDLKNNPTHSFTWKGLLLASLNKCIRQNMKGSIIALERP